MTPPLLEIKDLHATVEGNEILKGVDLTVRLGEVHAIMGPNGSGKSTLAQLLAGHPAYTVTRGSVRLDGKDLFELDPEERARDGLFLAFQYPSSVPGVSVGNFFRRALEAQRDGFDPHAPETPSGAPCRPARRLKTSMWRASSAA